VAPRGKLRSNRQYNPGYPGLLIDNLVDRHTYAYRGFYVDAARAVDFLHTRPEVDRARIGVHGSSQGGALTITTAALRPDAIRCGAAGAPYLCGFMDAAALTHSYPYEEINEYLRRYPDREPAVRETLNYFDGINFAPRIRCPMRINLGLRDDVCPQAVPVRKWRVRLVDTAQLPDCAHDAAFLERRVEAFLAHTSARAYANDRVDRGVLAGCRSRACGYPGRAASRAAASALFAASGRVRGALTSIGPYRIFGYYGRPLGRVHSPLCCSLPLRQRNHVLTTTASATRSCRSCIVGSGWPISHLPSIRAAHAGYRVARDICVPWHRRGLHASAEFLLSRPEVNPDAVGIMGDDLALLTAARARAGSPSSGGGLHIDCSRRARVRRPIGRTQRLSSPAAARRDAVARTLRLRPG
jgi:dienelactone hydrolase